MARRGPGGARLGVDACVAAAWALLGLTALAVLVTYARLPAAETYRVSREGLAGGLGRALVLLNFPVAPAVLPAAGLAAGRLLGPAPHPAGGRRAAVLAASVAATALCLLPTVPGVVDPADLDARPVNLLPAAGVLLALGLCVAAYRAGSGEPVPARRVADRLGAALGVAVAVVSVPWVLAEVGVYADEVPGLGLVFVAGAAPAGESLAAVHLGHHHGTDGLLLVATALLLGRAARAAAPGLLAGSVRVYLGVMVAYGLYNVVHDGWDEQLVKPGRVERRVPDVLGPELDATQGLLLLGALAAWLLLFRPPAARGRASAGLAAGPPAEPAPERPPGSPGRPPAEPAPEPARRTLRVEPLRARPGWLRA